MFTGKDDGLKLHPFGETTFMIKTENNEAGRSTSNWIYLDNIFSLVINGNEVVPIVRCTICMVF